MDTENHICNTRFSFFIAQPIRLKSDLLNNLFENTEEKEIYNKFISKNPPKWLKNIKKYGNAYKGIDSIIIDSIEKSFLVKDLKDNKFMVNGTLDLNQVMLKEEITVHLLFDKSLRYFMLVYEIPILLNESMIDKYIKVNSNQVVKRDLYNTIRNLFVKEFEYSLISNWVNMYQKGAIDVIRVMLEQVYSLKTIKEDIYFPTNTGNISNIVKFGNEESCSRAFINRITKLNDYAEIKIYQNENIILGDGTIYDFNGRFHTIIAGKSSDKDRYIPIQFHLQYMWSYLNAINELLANINCSLMEKGLSPKRIGQISDSMDYCIQKVQYLNIFHNEFLRAIESDNEYLYQKVEKLWNIDSSLKVTDTYVKNLKDLVSRRFQRVSSTIQEKQSKIVYIITVIQITSLIGVWQTYMQLTNLDSSSTNNWILKLFGSLDNLIVFNTFLPILFLAIGLILWVLGFKNKRK